MQEVHEQPAVTALLGVQPNIPGYYMLVAANLEDIRGGVSVMLRRIPEVDINAVADTLCDLLKAIVMDLAGSPPPELTRHFTHVCRAIGVLFRADPAIRDNVALAGWLDSMARHVERDLLPSTAA